MQGSAVAQRQNLPGCEGEWTRLARGRRTVVVSWRAGVGRLQVEGTVACNGVEQPFALWFNPDSGHGDAVKLVWDGIDVTLSLARSALGDYLDGQLLLMCNLPLTSNSFFNGPIAAWTERPLPAPDSEPADDDVDAGIEGTHQAVDLFPFVWLHRPGLRELIDIDRSFIRLASLGLAPAQLDLYNTLAAHSGAGAAAAKQADAAAFRSSAAFAGALSALPVPLPAFPAWRAGLERLPGPVDNIDLDEMAFLLLDQAPAAFLAGATWMAAQSDIWQSLFALALVGTPADAVLAVQLTDVLRVGHFLQLLASQRYQDLGQWRTRQLVLGAQPVLPDAAAAFPPDPAIGGTAAGGSWEVLGVGTLKIARQRLHAYLPGELAEVVNVMPRERQEVQERTLSGRIGSDSDACERASQQHSAHLSSASNELSDAVQEAMAAGGVLRDLNNVQPAYNNLSLTLSGAVADGTGDSGWAGQDASRYLQQLTDQAARQLGERVSRQRGSVWQELRERQQSNVIDNSGNGRLVGVYRWIDRVMRVHLEEAGRRLVFSFLIDQPAAAWLARIEGEGALPLVKPVPLPAFSVANGQGYQAITAGNYQSWGAQYGLADMAPPPPATIEVSGSFERVSSAEAACLRIPDGYIVDSGCVTMGLADGRYNLMCSIAGVVYSSPAALAQARLDTVVPVPASTATSITDAIVSPPVMPTTNVTVQPLTKISGASGVVQVTLMTAAPLFVVQVDLQCKRVSAAAPVPTATPAQAASTTTPAPAPVTVDQEMTAWQIRTYERLLDAYLLASRRYDEQLAARIAAATASHGADVQRNALRQSCLELLAPGGDADPQQFRFLDPLFAWAAMSWHYEPWHAGTAGIWPEPVSGDRPQPASRHLFDLFLRAPSARVLLPVVPGSEAWLLFYLQYGQPWAGGPASTPITSSSVLALEEIHPLDANSAAALAPAEPACSRGWNVRVPTSMLYLQGDACLPRFGACVTLPVAPDPIERSTP